MTRSLHAISHGDLTSSLRYHLFGPAVFIAMLLDFLLFTTEAISGKKWMLPAGRRFRNKALVGIAVAWLAYWAIRLAAEFE
jgi:hypothetical protein